MESGSNDGEAASKSDTIDAIDDAGQDGSDAGADNQSVAGASASIVSATSADVLIAEKNNESNSNTVDESPSDSDGSNNAVALNSASAASDATVKNDVVAESMSGSTDDTSAPKATDEDDSDAVDEEKIVYAKPSIAATSHVQNIGWRDSGTLTAGKSIVIGSTGKSLRLEAFKFTLSYPNSATGETKPTGDIQIDSYVQGVRWQGWKSSGSETGTTGQSKRIEAVRMRLTDELASQYDVYYRVHVQNVGWMPWAKNGASAGTIGRDLRVEAVEVMLVEKGSSSAPSTGQSFQDSSNLKNRAHVQNIGWQSWVGSGQVIGTSGQSKRIEALQLNLSGYEYSGGIRYRSHVQNIGWQGWVSDGALSGTTGRSLRLEAVQIELTGDIANYYDIYYRVHVQNIGWMPWTKNGGYAGTQGYSLRMEAIEIRMVKKGEGAPSTGVAFLGPASISTRGYVKDVGWQSWSGSTAGTTGKSKALTGIQYVLSGDGRPSGNVNYRVLDASGSWASWVQNGSTAGSENGSKLRAIQMTLDGDMASRYDIYYRVHVSKMGWLGWAKNGASAGSAIDGYQIEAVEVRLVSKGGSAPGSTSGAYFDSNTAKVGWQNPSGYYQVSRFTVKLTAAAYNTPFSYVTPSRISLTATRQDCINAFVQRAYEYLGTPYVWNYSRQVGVGVDCIGLVYQCAYATGMDMGEFNPYNHYYSGTNGWHSHDAMNVWNYGKIQRLSFSQRQYGDLIFYPGHVGIYVGNDKIIEASSISGKVVMSSVYRYSTIYGVGRLYV